MPTLYKERKMVSDYVGGFTDVHGTQFSCARVTVVAPSTITVDPIGFPVMWNGTAFKLFVTGDDIAAITTDSTLPDGSPVGVIVGSKAGFGENVEDVTFGTGGEEFTVMFRGPGSVKADEIDYTHADVAGNTLGEADAGEKGEFLIQLEKQGIAGLSTAAVVTPTYVTE